ncbi:MAG: response regulator, partial [Maribacter sp.]
MNDKLAVWIIDDDDISKYVLKRNLQELNVHNVKDFPDSIAPLEILKLNSADPQSLPDIIFLDINMPILDGFQFMEDYTLFNDKIDKKIKIYMLSSS